LTVDPNDTERAIAALIELTRQGFLKLDPQLLGSIWDSQHEPLIYVAQEREEPLHGWTAIQSYYVALPEHLDAVSSKEIDGIKIDPLGDTAAAFFQFRSTVKLKGRETLHRPTGRVTMIFRRTSSGWRAIHYHESALGALAAQAKSGSQ
jgi:ketosteroid isomerase-like protein